MNNNIEMTINIENLINLNHDGIVKAENLIDQNDFEKIIDKKTRYSTNFPTDKIQIYRKD